MTDIVTVTHSENWATLGPPTVSNAGTGSSEPVVNVGISARDIGPVSNAWLGPQQLYGDIDDSLLSHVSQLLQQARSALRQAAQLDPSSEFAQFDQQIMIARTFIGRALNCRDIGQGFTSVVNAMNWALANRGEAALTKKQLAALLGALDRVSWSPYLHFDTAMAVLDELETVGLNIESPTLEMITAELDG
jgi:hypothetical protein